MPISRNEFEKGEVSYGLAAVNFLRLNREQAYSLDELWQQLRLQGVLSVEDFAKVLEQQIVSGKLERNVIGEKRYYIWASRIGFRRA